MKPAKNKKSKFKLFLSAISLFLLISPFSLHAEPVQAPAFSEIDIQGNRQSLEQYKGKKIVLYFWATWCPSCRGDVKQMIEIYQMFHRKGVEFISVSLDQDLSKLQKFVKEKNIPYPVIFDGKGWENQLARLYGIDSIPSFFLINERGELMGAGNAARDLKEHLIVVS